MKLIEKISGISIATSTFLLLAPKVFAETQGGGDINGTVIDPCTAAGTSNAIRTKLCDIGAGSIGTVIANAIVIVLIVAVVIALVFLIWGGLKWITSGGDKTKVESARGTIIAAIVGLIIAFLAYFVLNIVLGFFGLSLLDLKLPSLTTSA